MFPVRGEHGSSRVSEGGNHELQQNSDAPSLRNTLRAYDGGAPPFSAWQNIFVETCFQPSQFSGGLIAQRDA